MKILIFRLGHIGDTSIAMPALRHVRKRFPAADIAILTNFPQNTTGKACPLSQIIGASGITEQFLEYPTGNLNRQVVFQLFQSVRAFKPDLLVYLMPTRSRAQLLRDWLFFKLCGIRRIIGLNFSPRFQERLFNSDTGLWEHEAQRLGRLLAPLGQIDLASRDSWDLRLSVDEANAAREALSPLGERLYFALSVGTKVDAKDWGVENWISLNQRLSRHYPDHGLVLVGSQDEIERCERIARDWPSTSLNLCGRLSPRVSAAVLRSAALFVGHDSGPMHLAAAVGTPVIAIFSARNKPGEWFPWGSQHRVLYNKTDCFGCRLDVCTEEGKKCIYGISVDAVVDAVLQTHPPERFAAL